MAYVVFQDLEGSKFVTRPEDLTIVHKVKCGCYRRRNVSAATMTWSEPFATLAEAVSYAQKVGKRFSQARCCLSGRKSKFARTLKGRVDIL